MQIKPFLKLFFLLLIVELIIGFVDVFFHQNNTDLFGIQLDSLTSILVHVISMPINLFGRDLPFYYNETWIAISLTIINIAIQSFIIFRIYKTLKK